MQALQIKGTEVSQKRIRGRERRKKRRSPFFAFLSNSQIIDAGHTRKRLSNPPIENPISCVERTSMIWFARRKESKR